MTLVGVAGRRMMMTGGADGLRAPRPPNQLSILPFPPRCKLALMACVYVVLKTWYTDICPYS